MTNEIERVGNLEVGEKLKFRHRDCTAQRVGRTVMAAVVAALSAFAGSSISR